MLRCNTFAKKKRERGLPSSKRHMLRNFDWRKRRKQQGLRLSKRLRRANLLKSRLGKIKKRIDWHST
jgi:hypothetical protein